MPPQSTNTPRLETERLILRRFTEADIPAMYTLFSDEDVNRYLPFFPVKNLAEAREFYEKRFAPVYEQERGYSYAICLKTDDVPIGYIVLKMDDAHEFGFCLRKEFWNQGVTTEAGHALIEQAKRDGIPFVTATHDANNPASGAVLKRIGLVHQYSYEEMWQPKGFLVTFRMYQQNFTMPDDYVYRGYKLT